MNESSEVQCSLHNDTEMLYCKQHFDLEEDVFTIHSPALILQYGLLIFSESQVQKIDRVSASLNSHPDFNYLSHLKFLKKT